MTEYTHFERSAPCASPGYYVGRKDSEVKLADGSGYLYSAGIKVAGAAGRLFQAGNELTEAATGGMYAKSSPTVGAISGRIAGGTFSCSQHASIDTGLTTVYAAVCQVVGRIVSGKIATLDSIASPDTTPDGKSGYPHYVQHRIRTNYLRVRTYCRKDSEPATLNNASKRCLISWIALGT